VGVKSSGDSSRIRGKNAPRNIKKKERLTQRVLAKVRQIWAVGIVGKKLENNNNIEGTEEGQGGGSGRRVRPNQKVITS